MSKTAAQIARENAIAQQNANTQQGLMQLKQQEALKSKNFLTPENATEGSLQGPTLSQQFGTGVGGSAYLMPTDYGTEPEMDRVWEQPVATPSITTPEDIELEEFEPLKEIEQVPGLTQEYYNKVQLLNDLSVGSRSAGFNIKKPDMSNPRQAKAYTLYQQVLGETQELGAKLQEGYKAVKFAQENPDKVAQRLYQQETGSGVTRATKYGDFAGATVLDVVKEFNDGTKKFLRTTSQDDPAFKARQEEYETLRNNLAMQRDQFQAEGDAENAKRVQESMDALQSPFQQFNLEAAKLAEQKKQRKQDYMSKTIDREATDYIYQGTRATKDVSAYVLDSKTGLYTYNGLNGRQWNEQPIARITLGDKNGDNSIQGKPEDVQRYNVLARRKRVLEEMAELSEEQIGAITMNDAALKYLKGLSEKFNIDFELENAFELENGEVKTVDGKAVLKTLSQEDLKFIEDYESNTDYQITVWTQQTQTDKETGQKSVIEVPNTISNNASNFSDILAQSNSGKDYKSVLDTVKQKRGLLTKTGDLNTTKVLGGAVTVEITNEEGKIEKVAMSNKEAIALARVNAALEEGNINAVYEHLHKFPGGESEGDGVFGFWESEENMRLGVKTNPAFKNRGYDKIEIRYTSDSNKYKIIKAGGESNEVISHPSFSSEALKKYNVSDDRAEGLSWEGVIAFLKYNKIVENDTTLFTERLKRNENILVQYQKELNKRTQMLDVVEQGKVTTKTYGSSTEPVDPNSRKKILNWD